MQAVGGFQTAGSSPQMRGAQDVGHADVDLLGIIPADAGSTMVSKEAAVGAEDHPRRCGEHSLRKA